MNTKRKYFLLILLLILPVVFYSLSYVKVSKSLGSIETPEILNDYDEENLVAADTSKACNKYSKSTCDGKIYTKGNIKYECAYGGISAGCYAKYKYITSSTAGYYKCSGSCSYKKANDKVEASNTVCSGPYKTSLCGATPTYTATFKSSNTSTGVITGAGADGLKKTCKIEDGHLYCDVNIPTVSIKKTGYTLAGWSYDHTCKQLMTRTSGTFKINKNITYWACFKESGGSSNTPSSDNSYTLNAIRYITQDISSLGLKKCDTVYVKVCNGSAQGAICTFDKDKKGGSSGRGLDAKYFATSKPSSCSSTPVQPVKTDDTVKTTINDDMYVIRDTGILNCGDKVRVTTCTSTGNNTTKVCDITIVNNKITSTQVDFSNLTYSYNDVPASCKEQTLYTTKTVPEYTSTSQIGNSVSSKIPCGTMVTVENMATSCSYGPGKNYCEAKLNGKTVYIQSVNLADAKPSECPTESDDMVCIYNSSKNDYKWVKKSEADNDYSNGYKDTEIANQADCKAPSDGEQSCTTSAKATNVTDEKKIINVCYEKKNDKITDDIDINTMYTCASDYTKNPAKLNEDTCKNIKNGTCHKSYVVSCSSAKRPGIEIASSLLNQGVGTITIRGRKVAADVKSYYLDEQKVPSNDSLWKDFSDANIVAYEQKPAGLYYAWVRDVNGLISRPMYAIVHDADITNTLKSLNVSDANDVALTLRTIDGTTANTDEIMPSNYALLSNRLNTDSTLAGFDSLSMGYEIDVNSSKISVYATLTSEDAKYVDGYEPRTVDLDYGRNTILIKIQSNSGKVRTYTIIANRTDDRVNNNLLSDLTVSKGSISFDPYVTNYDINVGKNVKSVNINANLASDTSAFVSGFEPRSVDLNNDVTTAIIKTISETGSTRSYVLTFNKTLDEEEEVSNSALLDTLFIRGTVLGFNKEVFDYSVTIPYEYSFTEVYAFPESDNATVEISGNANLQVGANNVEIKVTNKNKTNVYNVTVNRKEPGLDVSNDVTLSSLNVKGYKIDFKPEVLDYQVKIKRERSLIITATPTSNRSDVYMYGNNDLTGFSTVRVKVVAENGNTNIYSIDIQKDSYNKVLEVTATVIGSVIFLGAAIIIVVRKKNKKMKEYLGK
ncbi:MAG: cadherin-like beta sandwich domain-containing protein [bacterium]|nr:cadherin-like beta sandwich domain-containing protein [bacterium]